MAPLSPLFGYVPGNMFESFLYFEDNVFFYFVVDLPLEQDELPTKLCTDSSDLIEPREKELSCEFQQVLSSISILTQTHVPHTA